RRSFNHSLADRVANDLGRNCRLTRINPDGAKSRQNLFIGKSATIDGHLIDHALEKVRYAAAFRTNRYRSRIHRVGKSTLDRVAFDQSAVNIGPHFDVSRVNLSECSHEIMKYARGRNCGLLGEGRAAMLHEIKLEPGLEVNK